MIDPNDWNHIVLKYNESGIKLFDNFENNISDDYKGEIAISDESLIIGGYNCIMDEVAIYNKAIPELDIYHNYLKYS